MSLPIELQRGREAFERRAWTTAREALEAARGSRPLDPDDLWRLGVASFLTGDEDGFVSALEEAHRAHQAAGENEAAARCAFWMGFHLANRAEIARASGWFGRASRMLERTGTECALRGYLLLPLGLRHLSESDYAACGRIALEAQDVGERFGDADLLAMAMHMRGRAFLRQGRVDEGLALLDEAMVAVVSDELSPQVTGLVYCSVISACREVFAVRRAQEWTDALRSWCDRQPDMVQYTGECHVYRSEILQRHGAWAEALEEARHAREQLSGGQDRATEGAARYQMGELHRLTGDFAAAEEEYRAASRLGREPLPGLALLRRAQGDAESASSSMRRALAEAEEPFRRAKLLPAFVEILLDAGEVDEASRTCDELERIASAWGASALGAVVSQWRGASELRSGRAGAALPLLRGAWKEWQALGAPYEAARTRLLLGLACRALGDEDGADLELEAARSELERLGARPDVMRLDAETGRERPREVHGLTPREREVLAQVATGRTNRAIAEALFISEKTVERHVANIFRKLGVSSRSAATAFAYEHGLRDPPA